MYSAIYDSHALPQASTNNLIHNDKKSGTLDTIRIRTFDIDWYTLATVDGPMKVLSGKQVNFILDLTRYIIIDEFYSGHNHRKWRTVCSYFPPLP